MRKFIHIAWYHRNTYPGHAKSDYRAWLLSYYDDFVDRKASVVTGVRSPGQLCLF